MVTETQNIGRDPYIQYISDDMLRIFIHTSNNQKCGPFQVKNRRWNFSIGKAVYINKLNRW